jgi:hypothetical protein
MAQVRQSAVSRLASGTGARSQSASCGSASAAGMCSSLVCVPGPLYRGTDAARAPSRDVTVFALRLPEGLLSARARWPRADGRNPRGTRMWHAERARALGGGRADLPRWCRGTQQPTSRDSRSKRVSGGVGARLMCGTTRPCVNAPSLTTQRMAAPGARQRVARALVAHAGSSFIESHVSV